MSLKTLRGDRAAVCQYAVCQYAVCQYAACQYAACQYSVYRTGPAEKSFTESGRLVAGGKCTIGGNDAGPGAHDLEAVANTYSSTDFFYPWMRTGTGWVKVPKSVADGSVVMTGGVNGCTSAAATSWCR